MKNRAAIPDTLETVKARQQPGFLHISSWETPFQFKLLSSASR